MDLAAAVALLVVVASAAVAVAAGGLPVKKAANPDNNPEPATCKSAEMERHLHAMHDAIETRLRSGGRLRGGQILMITYDDGGTEEWEVTAPTFSDPLSDIPVPGTLHCPGG